MKDINGANAKQLDALAVLGAFVAMDPQFADQLDTSREVGAEVRIRTRTHEHISAEWRQLVASVRVLVQQFEALALDGSALVPKSRRPVLSDPALSAGPNAFVLVSTLVDRARAFLNRPECVIVKPGTTGRTRDPGAVKAVFLLRRVWLTVFRKAPTHSKDGPFARYVNAVCAESGGQIGPIGQGLLRSALAFDVAERPW